MTSMFNNAVKLMNADAIGTANSQKFSDESWYTPKKDRWHDMFIRPMPDVVRGADGGPSPGQHMNVSLYHELLYMKERFEDSKAKLPAASELAQSLDTSGQDYSPLRGPDVYLHGLQRGTYNTSGFRSRSKRQVTASRIFGPLMHQRRQKRAIWAVIAAGIVGTIFGIFSANQIHSITKNDHAELLVQNNEERDHVIRNINDRITNVVALARDNAHINILEVRYMAWTGIVRHIQKRLQQWLDLTHDLHKHRLHSGWFTAKQMDHLHKIVMKFGRARNLKPLTEFPSDYFQIDVSFVSSPNDLVLILHVPATKYPDKWSIYRYHPFPIPNQDGYMTMISAPEPLIAIGPNGLHKALTETDLDKCLQRNHVYMCEAPIITLTSNEGSCIGALMGQLPNVITKRCQVKLEAQREVVVQAGERTFAIFSPEVFTAQGECLNGTSITKYITSTSRLTLDSGCTLRLKQHLLSAPFSIITPRVPMVEKTNWDTMEVPRELLRHVDAQEMRLYSTLLADKNLSLQVEDGLRLSQAQLTRLHKSLANQVHSAQWNHFWITVAIALVLGVIVSVISYLCCARYFCPKPDVSLSISKPASRRGSWPQTYEMQPVRESPIMRERRPSARVTPVRRQDSYQDARSEFGDRTSMTSLNSNDFANVLHSTLRHERSARNPFQE
ncbi:MAG: hypothetical protein ACR2JI_00200 [Mycobacterium sp.]